MRGPGGIRAMWQFPVANVRTDSVMAAASFNSCMIPASRMKMLDLAAERHAEGKHMDHKMVLLLDCVQFECTTSSRRMATF